MKILLLDVDGTLIDSYPGIRASFIHAMQTHGYDIPPESFLRTLPGPPMRDSLARAGVPASELDATMADYSSHQANGGWLMSRVFPGLLELVRTWKEEGYVIATATSKSFTGAHRALQHYGFLPLCDVLGTASDDGERQRKVDVVDYTLGKVAELVSVPRAELDLSQVLMVGDRIHDVDGARAHGVRSVAVEWGYGSDAEQAAADFRVTSPAQLSELVEQF